MRSALILISTLVWMFAHAEGIIDQNTPRIQKVQEQLTVHIPSSAQQAVKAWNAKFKVLANTAFTPRAQAVTHEKNAPPFAAVGDFNGDGIDDLALLGASNNEVEFIFVLAKGLDWEIRSAVAFREGEFDTSNLDLYIINLEMPERHFLEGHRDFTGKVVMLELFGGMSKAFFVKSGKVIEHSGETEPK